MTAEWREHPKLRGHLSAEHPDDVQVIAHDGGPRITQHKPELVWVTVTGCDNDVFTGRILNRPDQLSSVSEGSEIRFVVPDSGEHALMATDKYLCERSDWIIHPCQQCGLSELFDAPSDLMQVAFPDAPPGSVMEMLTAFCGACGGIQIVQHKEAQIDNEFTREPAPKRRHLWK